MTGRGRPAALPTAGYRMPRRLFTDAGDCRVRVFPERGGPSADFDFTRFPTGRELTLWLATAFAGVTGPSGKRRTRSSAKGTFATLRRFSDYLATLQRPPSSPAQLRGVHLDGFLLAHAGSRALSKEVGTLRSALRFASEMPEEFAARLNSTRMAKKSIPLASYTTTEFDRIAVAARTHLRRTADRVHAARALLACWRAGELDRATDRAAWEQGWLLDHVDRHGDVPRHDTRWGLRQTQIVTRHGGAGPLMAQLYPTFLDIGAAIALLICLTGQNASTLVEAPARYHRPDGHTGPVPSAVVELVKPRRGRRAHMSTTLQDRPPDQSSTRQAGRRHDLHTPFGVFTLLVDLTRRAREHAGIDKLLVFYSAKGHCGRGFRTGLGNDVLMYWGRSIGLSADTLGEDGAPIPLSVDSRRLRLTWLERHQQPVAHTERTLANEYLARNRGNLAEYQKVVADVLHAQLTLVRTAQLMRVLTVEDIELARTEPDQVAARHGLDTSILEQVLAGQLDTVLGACTDNLHSPHTPAGQPCQASFLLCLSCPCARATPQHLPLLVAVHDGLLARRPETTPLRWAQRFAAPAAQLADLLDRFPATTVADARAQLTAEQRDLAERFLTRGLDLT